jgi:hypothetical protein
VVSIERASARGCGFAFAYHEDGPALIAAWASMRGVQHPWDRELGERLVSWLWRSMSPSPGCASASFGIRSIRRENAVIAVSMPLRTRE